MWSNALPPRRSRYICMSPVFPSSRDTVLARPTRCQGRHGGDPRLERPKCGAEASIPFLSENAGEFEKERR